MGDNAEMMLDVSQTAVFSPCGGYRYFLRRELPDGGTLIVVNLFGAVSTDPNEIVGHRDPIGVDNDAWVLAAVRHFLSDANVTVFNMLNGSTAGADNNDPTVRRTIHFAQHQAKGKYVCAWGAHKATTRRPVFNFKQMLRGEGIALHRFVRGAGSFPPHPLYLPNDCPVEVWA